MSKKIKGKIGNANDDKKFPLPIYGKKDDIYNRGEEEHLDDEGNLIKNPGAENKSIDDGLDIPGAELDDTDEIIGEEDEENNYYSLGGDNHDNLEEDKGE